MYAPLAVFSFSCLLSFKCFSHLYLECCQLGGGKQIIRHQEPVNVPWMSRHSIEVLGQGQNIWELVTPDLAPRDIKWGKCQLQSTKIPATSVV